MAKRAVRFRLSSGSVLVEIPQDSAEGPGEARVSRAGVVVSEASKTFEEAFESIPDIANSLIAKLHTVSQAPEETEIEFSVNLTAGADVIIAKTTIEGAFKIKVKWVSKNS
jgi:hypothetical protein